MKLFLTECKNNLLRIVGEDKYKLIETDFIPNLDTNETFQNNNNFTEKLKNLALLTNPSIFKRSMLVW